MITSWTECIQNVLRLHTACSFLPSYQAEENIISTNSCFTICAPTSLEVDNSALVLVSS